MGEQQKVWRDQPSSSPSPSAVSIPTSSQSFSRAAKSSLASENSPSSIPSPTYQWTKALLAYIKSNLWSSLENTSAMAVVLEIMQQALMTLARSPPGTTVGGWQLMPTLKPVGHQSTNWMVLLVLMVAMAALTSLGTTSPLYIMEQAMYFPCLGSHLAIMLAGSKQLLVISATESCSWQAFSAEMMGEQEDNMKWILGQGTKLVWNSVTSTLRAPSNRREAVREEMTWEMSLFKLVQVGLSMSRFLLQMSQTASLSSMTATSVCSRREWVDRMELQGSTTAVETWGEGQMVKPSLDFLPQSTESLSRRREPNPEPVPPPTEWNMRKPWRPVQLSASFLILSRQRSTISLPMVQCPLAKLLAASSFPEMSCSGWKSCLQVPVLTSSMTVGSRSRKTHRGTCFPAPVSEKKVLKASSPPPIVLSEGI